MLGEPLAVHVMVFSLISLEFLRGSRRGRLDALRRIYAGWLILQLLFLVTHLQGRPSQAADPTQLSRFVNGYLELFIWQHFVILFLAIPPYVAGAIADAKAGGAIHDLLTTDLASWEIVVGTLVGRLAQVGLLALAGMPLIAFVGGCGHLDGVTLLALAAVTLAPFFALGAISMLASIWSRQTRDAVLRVYLWCAAACLIIWLFHQIVLHHLPRDQAFNRPLTLLDAVLQCLNPIHVLEPVWNRQEMGTLLERLLAGSGVWSLIGLVCVIVAARRLRDDCMSHFATAPPPQRSVSDRPEVDDDPAGKNSA